MFLIKALPLMVAVTRFNGWQFSDFLSAILFDLLAGIIFMITLAGLLFGVCVPAWKRENAGGALRNLHHPKDSRNG